MNILIHKSPNENLAALLNRNFYALKKPKQKFGDDERDFTTAKIMMLWSHIYPKPDKCFGSKECQLHEVPMTSGKIGLYKCNFRYVSGTDWDWYDMSFERYK